jgi:hypothetical protein
VLTTSGTYPWSFVTQIFHNGQYMLYLQNERKTFTFTRERKKRRDNLRLIKSKNICFCKYKRYFGHKENFSNKSFVILNNLIIYNVFAKENIKRMKIFVCLRY